MHCWNCCQEARCPFTQSSSSWSMGKVGSVLWISISAVCRMKATSPELTRHCSAPMLPA